MDEDALGHDERRIPEGPDGHTVPGTGPAVAGPEAAALAAEADEIRRLVEAGAGSPDELRALAERLRAHRAREEALWRTQVKPTLKAKRGALIGGAQPSTPLVDPATSHASRQSLTLGLGLLALVVLVVLLAASSSVLWVLLPVVGVLAAAWWQGKQAR